MLITYYIGQTERTICKCCSDYRRAVSDEKYHSQGMRRHIMQCGKDRLKNTPFFKFKSNDQGHTIILTCESQFIKKYKPALNYTFFKRMSKFDHTENTANLENDYILLNNNRFEDFVSVKN